MWLDKCLKRPVSEMFKKSRFRTPFESQQGKESEKHLKPAWQQHFYHIFIIFVKIELENVPVSGMRVLRTIC